MQIAGVTAGAQGVRRAPQARERLDVGALHHEHLPGAGVGGGACGLLVRGQGVVPAADRREGIATKQLEPAVDRPGWPRVPHRQQLVEELDRPLVVVPAQGHPGAALQMRCRVGRLGGAQQVIGQIRRPVVRRLGVGRRQGIRDAPVVGRGVFDGCHDGPPKQVVGEGVAHTGVADLGRDHLAPLQAGERLQGLSGAQPLEHARVHGTPTRGQEPQRLPGRIRQRQPRQPLPEHALETVGQVFVAQLTGHHPAVGGALDPTAGDEHANGLDEVQRHPGRLARQRRQRVCEPRRDGTLAEHRLAEAAGVLAGQRPHRTVDQPASPPQVVQGAGRPAAVHVAGGRQHPQGGRGGRQRLLVHQLQQRFEGCLIRPMQVFEHQEHAAGVGLGGLLQPAAQLLHADGGVGLGIHLGPRRDHALGQGVLEHGQGRGPAGAEAPSQHPDTGQLGLADDLAHQPRLADACAAAQGTQAPPSALRRPPGVDDAELPGTAHEARPEHVGLGGRPGLQVELPAHRLPQRGDDVRR